jgi:outer membrane protein assembly factor BamB
MIKLTQKETDILKNISHISGIFTLIVALTMLYGFIQLKTINPLDNPAFVSLKEEYDKDPDNANKIEQVRAMDLVARKAYYSTRRQIETGSYLLIAGAIVFIICQRLIAGNEKAIPAIPGEKPDPGLKQRRGRKLIMISASAITLGAILSSFLLRSNLPELRTAKKVKTEESAEGDNITGRKINTAVAEEFKPDPTNYPFFRGQDSRGIAGGDGYPTEWNAESGLNIKWKLEVPGYGKSSPVIWGDRIFLTTAVKGTMGEVYCIDKNSGTILWSVSATGIPGEPSDLPEMDAEAGLAVPTAAVNSTSVCAIFANGNLLCLDHDGNKKWALNVGSLNSIYGYSSSLVIHDNTLIIQHDSKDDLSILGYDIDTGEMKWKTARNGMPVWSSPIIATFNGQPQVIVNGNPAVTAFDPSDGKELWSVDCLTGDVAPSLAANSNMVFAVTDYQKLAAIKPGAGASIVWEDNMYTSDVSSPVANNSILVIATGYGDVAFYNAQAGDTVWTHYFSDQFYSSPVIAGDMVYLTDRSGTTHIVNTANSFSVVSECPLGEPVDCTPAFSDKMIFIRGRDNIYCIARE